MERNVEAIIRISEYVQHGTSDLGTPFPACICPKQPCGGVASDDQWAHCPEHAREPVQLWHWAAECPGTTSP